MRGHKYTSDHISSMASHHIPSFSLLLDTSRHISVNIRATKGRVRTPRGGTHLLCFSIASLKALLLEVSNLGSAFWLLWKDHNIQRLYAFCSHSCGDLLSKTTTNQLPSRSLNCGARRVVFHLKRWSKPWRYLHGWCWGQR